MGFNEYWKVITVACVVLVIGIFFVAVAPFLSALNLAGIILICAVPGALVGYVRNRTDRWGGFFEWGVWSGVTGFVVLYAVLASGLVPEREPPPLPGHERRPQEEQGAKPPTDAAEPSVRS
jgi:membrane protease YdiL (CAAX protease family)